MGKTIQNGKNGMHLIILLNSLISIRISIKKRSIRTYDEKMGVYSELLMEKNDQIIGSVVYYWEHEPSRWLEIGITIFETKYWNGGYGTEAINVVHSYLFENIGIERVGLTTWSGK